MKPVLDVSLLLQGYSVRALHFELGKTSYTEFEQAIAKGCKTGKPLSTVQRFSKKALARAIDSVLLDGVPPSSISDWRDVNSSLHVKSLRPEIEELWSRSRKYLSLPSLPDSLPAMINTANLCAGWNDRIERAADQLFDLVESLELLFPIGLEVRQALGILDFDRLIDALEANLGQTSQPSAVLEALQNDVENSTGGLARLLQSLHDSIGSSDTKFTDQELLMQRSLVTDEIERIREQQSELDRVAKLLDTLRDSGAPLWADRLQSRPTEAEALLPIEWRDSWSWAQMTVRISQILDLGNGDDLLDRKRQLAADRQRRLRELIRAKTLLGLKPRMSDEVRSALQAFTIAVRRLGKGSGANAPRWRRAMREEAMKASRAAPVWIMPEYKVSEQLPSLASSFDLVILDEASQCDVTSLASLARGARCLIVGDEKQVSPSSVGLPSQRINALRAEFLSTVPARNLIDQDTSIFDLAAQMYPSSRLMLKEHFRCVEPIIRFSSRFYQDRLVPLRVPKASERFDPPLVELHVAGASRDGITNSAEATVIVDEIAAIVQNPSHAWRGIAVISLIGRKQAELIERRLMADSRIGTEAMKRHRIICGDARTLQGQERSVVFLSMVAVPESVRSQSTKDIQQRMNVAMSRACDRLYLAHSLSMSDLKPGDIKSDVLKHFRDPMPEGGSSHDKSTLDSCESGFERDVCKRLMDANYRTRAQVRAGPFRIDLVVEGADDRRLAIELDGDHWHGPDVWHRDMRRQASLERAGWTFWRVFGSQWVSNQSHHWNDLIATLGRLGIEPIGGEASNEIFSEARQFVVDGTSVRLRSVTLDDGDDIDESVADIVPTMTPYIDFDDTGVENDDVEESTSVGIDENLPVDELPDEVLDDNISAIKNNGDGLGNPVGREEQVEESSLSVDGDLTFYDENHQPILLEKLLSIVETKGPIDLDILTRKIAGQYGFKRTGRVIRDTVRTTLMTQRVITVCCETKRVTVWPAGETPEEIILWKSDMLNNVPDWDQLSAPARAGLVAYALDQRPEDLPRAVLNLIEQRKLTKRLVREIEASQRIAERYVQKIIGS